MGHIFKLYVTDHTKTSESSGANIRRLCDEEFPEGYELEVVDVAVEPGRMLDDDIIVTPTLVRLSPEPLLRVVGDFSNFATVAQNLHLRAADPEERQVE